MITGKLERGVIKKGDEAVIMGHGKSLKTSIGGENTHTIHRSEVCCQIFFSLL